MMMKLFILAAVFLVSTTQANATCKATMKWQWVPGLAIKAESQGPKCNSAIIRLSLQSKGKTIWRSEHQAEFLMGGADLKTAKDLKLSFETWFAPVPRNAKTSDKPNWPPRYKGTDLPPEAEFPFVPALGLTAKTYAEIQAQHAPLYCYVAGGEHQHCIYFLNGKIQDFGDQRFPG